MQTAVFDFKRTNEYQLPSTMQITADSLRLTLVEVAQDFIEDFADDTDFVYDTDTDEFVSGKIQQIVQNPANSLLYAKWQSSKDADYAVGTVVGTLGGTASIAGGQLSCVGDVVAYLDFSSVAQGDGSKGTARFKWTPKYSGAPASEKHIYFNAGTVDYKGAVWLIQLGTNLYFYMYDSTGSTVLAKTIAFSPTADTPYEFAITWDYTGEDDSNVFIDGILKDGGNVNATRGGVLSIHRLGNDLTSSRTADMLYDDFIVYDSVMFTSSYTPGYTLPATLYSESSAVLPEMQYIGDGAITAFNLMTVTSVGSARWTLQIDRSGNYLYWNGSNWVTADGTYAQATSPSDFNTHKADLPVEGAIYGQFKLHFPASDTQNSVDNLIVNMSIEMYTSNATALCLIPITAKKFVSMIHVATISGSDAVEYVLYKGCEEQDYYYDGSSWVVSTGYPQSNSYAEISANISTFLDGSSTEAVYLKIVLISADGTSTPILNKVVIRYYTKIGYTFKNYEVPTGQWGEALTADDIRYTYMWGVDMQASDTQSSEVDDAQLQYCVDCALAMWEKELNIDIRKRVYKTEPGNTLTQSRYWDSTVDYTDEEDRYDFSKQQWYNYGFIQLRHYPVLSIEKAELYDRLGGMIMDILDWTRINKKSGQLTIYPKGTFALGTGVWSGSAIFAAWPGMFNLNYPGAFVFDYTTGYKSSDFIDGGLREVIAMAATLVALGFVGDGLFAGFSSSSISLDGLSESFSSTQSATSAYFGARIKDYLDRMKEYRKHNKYKYSNIPVGIIYS